MKNKVNKYMYILGLLILVIHLIANPKKNVITHFMDIYNSKNDYLLVLKKDKIYNKVLNFTISRGWFYITFYNDEKVAIECFASNNKYSKQFLSDHLVINDSIFKNENSDTVYLRKLNGEKYFFVFPEERSKFDK